METSFTDEFVVFYPTSDADTILIEKEPESNLKQLFHRFQVPVTEQIKEKSSMTSSSAAEYNILIRLISIANCLDGADTLKNISHGTEAHTYCIPYFYTLADVKEAVKQRRISSVSELVEQIELMCAYRRLVSLSSTFIVKVDLFEKEWNRMIYDQTGCSIQSFNEL